jgi:hypothetical protein
MRSFAASLLSALCVSAPLRWIFSASVVHPWPNKLRILSKSITASHSWEAIKIAWNALLVQSPTPTHYPIRLQIQVSTMKTETGSHCQRPGGLKLRMMSAISIHPWLTFLLSFLVSSLPGFLIKIEQLEAAGPSVIRANKKPGGCLRIGRVW